MNRAGTSSLPTVSRRFGTALLNSGSFPRAVVVTLYTSVVGDGRLIHQVKTEPASPPKSIATIKGTASASLVRSPDVTALSLVAGIYLAPRFAFAHRASAALRECARRSS